MPVGSGDNLELYINILNYHFYENILNSFKNNKILGNEESKNLNEELLLKKNFLLFDIQKSNEEKVKSLDIQLDNIPRIYGTFNLFLLNLSNFQIRYMLNLRKDFAIKNFNLNQRI